MKRRIFHPQIRWALLFVVIFCMGLLVVYQRARQGKVPVRGVQQEEVVGKRLPLAENAQLFSEMSAAKETETNQTEPVWHKAKTSPEASTAWKLSRNWMLSNVAAVYELGEIGGDRGRRVTLVEPNKTPFLVRVEEVFTTNSTGQRQWEVVSEMAAEFVLVKFQEGLTPDEIEVAIEAADCVRVPMWGDTTEARVGLRGLDPDGPLIALERLRQRPEVHEVRFAYLTR